MTPDFATIDPTAPEAPRPRGRRVRAAVMLVLLSMIWGMTFPMMKLTLADMPAVPFIALRFGLAFPLLFLFLRLRHPRPWQAPDGPDQNAHLVHTGLARFWVDLRNGPLRSTWARGLVIGLFQFAGYFLQVLGLETTTASRSGFFTGLLVVLVPPLAVLLRTSRTPLLAWFALIPALVGITLIADPQVGGLNLGDWLTLGCALMFALQMVVLEALSRSDRESVVLTLAQIVTIGGLAGLWWLAEGTPVQVTTMVWIGIGYTAVFGSVIAVWLQTRYQPDVPAGIAAMIFTAEPVFAALFAWMLIGDPWTVRGLIGASFILGAMSLSSVALARQEKISLRLRRRARPKVPPPTP